MKELRARHWAIGAPLTLLGGAAYRFGHVALSGHALMACQLTGLAAIVIGLFIVARGVSRAAHARDSE